MQVLSFETVLGIVQIPIYYRIIEAKILKLIIASITTEILI